MKSPAADADEFKIDKKKQKKNAKTSSRQHLYSKQSANFKGTFASE